MPIGTSIPHFRDLSPARRRLVALMQDLHFGRIERLEIPAGEPVFDPAPSAIREIKLGNAEPAPPRPNGDFQLKGQVIDLIRELDALGDGVVEAIEVRHGLPFRVLVNEVLG